MPVPLALLRLHVVPVDRVAHHVGAGGGAALDGRLGIGLAHQHRVVVEAEQRRSEAAHVLGDSVAPVVLAVMVARRREGGSSDDCPCQDEQREGSGGVLHHAASRLELYCARPRQAITHTASARGPSWNATAHSRIRNDTTVPAAPIAMPAGTRDASVSALRTRSPVSASSASANSAITAKPCSS